MDDGEREFAFGEILADTLCLGVGRGGEVHVVVADLEEEADGVDEGDVIPSHHISQRGPSCSRHTKENEQTYFSLRLSACINSTASLNRPPVLFPTISR